MDRLILGIRRPAKRPSRDDLDRQAAAELAARIAEGRPPADAWRRRVPTPPRSLLGRTRHRPEELPAASWYVSSGLPAARVEPAPRTRPFVLRAVQSSAMDMGSSPVGRPQASVR